MSDEETDLVKDESRKRSKGDIWPELPLEMSLITGKEILEVGQADFQTLVRNQYLSIKPIKAAIGNDIRLNHDMLRKLAYVVLKRNEPEYSKGRYPNYELLGDEIRHNWFLENGHREEVEEFMAEKIRRWLGSKRQQKSDEESSEDILGEQ